MTGARVSCRDLLRGGLALGHRHGSGCAERFGAFADPVTWTREPLERVAEPYGPAVMRPLETRTRLWGTDPWTKDSPTNGRPGDVEATGPRHVTHEAPSHVCGSGHQWVAGYLEGGVRTGREAARMALRGPTPEGKPR